MYTFDDIYGNEQILKNLKSAILNDKISHAYIIAGNEGSGKRLIANTFAKRLECENNDGYNPCCLCMSCKVFDSHNHPDIIYIRAEKNKTLGVNDIRDKILKIVDIKQYKYKYKIFIIENADKMTIQAQNALLKTLEEPPHYAVFILIAENIELFLSTIISRCVVFKIRPLSNKIVIDYLKNISDDKKNELYAEYSQGSIGKALEIKNSENFIQMRENTINWFISIKNLKMIDLFELSKEFEIYKNDLRFLDIAYMLYRDIYVAKTLNDENYIIQKDKKGIIFQQSKYETLKSIAKKINIILNAKIQLSQNANFQLTIEVMLIKLKEIYNDRNNRCKI